MKTLKIKTLSVVFIIGVLFTSCGDRTPITPTIKNNYGGIYHIDIVDGCEYLYRTKGHIGFMAHKGNCNNPIHIYNTK